MKDTKRDLSEKKYNVISTIMNKTKRENYIEKKKTKSKERDEYTRGHKQRKDLPLLTSQNLKALK